jgi:hypothetical protein
VEEDEELNGARGRDRERAEQGARGGDGAGTTETLEEAATIEIHHGAAPDQYVWNSG